MMTRAGVRRASEVQKLFCGEEQSSCDDASSSETDDETQPHISNESETDAEEGENESDADAVQPAPKRGRHSFLRSNSGYKWSTNIPEKRGRRSLPSSSHICSPKGEALNATTALESWSVLFTDKILEIIIRYTNAEIKVKNDAMRDKNIPLRPYHKDVDLVELKGLIGLLYYAGNNKVNNVTTKFLWSIHASPLYKSTMTQNRFTFLLECLRFDDKSTRAQRKEADRFTHVREIWDFFISNCSENYDPGQNVTIDEQLLSFRGRCSFKMYMPMKPDKYGLQIISLNDAGTHYMIAAIPYVGKVDKLPEESVPSYYVRKLCEPIYNSGRNVTCDNWFTSIPICDKLKTDYNLTMVGTLKKNKREVPHTFKCVPKGKDDKARFAFSQDKKTLLSYNPKKSKIVLLLSSLHYGADIDPKTGKPEMIVFYNKTKGGVDAFDKKCHDYSTSRKTFRWPLRMFFGMLDQAVVNSFILFSLLENNAKMSRSAYMLELSLGLIKPLLVRRLLSPSLQTQLRLQIEEFVKYEDRPEMDDPRDFSLENKMDKHKRCQLCDPSSDRKTYFKCLKCDRPMCKEHVAKVCQQCALPLQNF